METNSEQTDSESHLLVFVPGQRLGGQDEPVLLGAPLHNADVDGQPAFPDHLHSKGVTTAEGDGGERGAGREGGREAGRKEGGSGLSQSGFCSDNMRRRQRKNVAIANVKTKSYLLTC